MLGSLLMIVFILLFFSVEIQDFSFVGKKNEKKLNGKKHENEKTKTTQRAKRELIIMLDYHHHTLYT
jgi:Tfp pilus assembly protein PilO